MAQPRDWPLERYRTLLKLQARRLQLDPRFQRRFDSSALAQSALTKAISNFAQFGGHTEAQLVKWLQEILANVVTDEIRKATAQKRDLGMERSLNVAIHESSSQLERFMAVGESSQSECAERNELLLRLAAALDEMPADQRDVVILRDFEGDKIHDIATKLGRSEKSVAGLLLRGRRMLRDHVKDYQETSHVAPPDHTRDEPER